MHTKSIVLLCLLPPLLSCLELDLSGLLRRGDKDLKFASMEVSVAAKRVFRLAFNPNHFHWEEGNYGGGPERPDYRYTAFLRDEADLPEWMKYKYSERHKAGFIYGVPPHANDVFQLDVVATNLITYELGLLRLTINVTASLTEEGGDGEKSNSSSTAVSTAAAAAAAPRCVKVKVDNLNLEDIFDAHRLRNLKELFQEHLWPESAQDLHLSYITSAPDAGYRRPLEPTLKDGVVVYLGSRANFSTELLELDRETSPLRSLPSCPRDFKRTSVERHFRAKGFALDWCEFRLLELSEEHQDDEEEEEEEEDEDVYVELGGQRPPRQQTRVRPKIVFNDTGLIMIPDLPDIDDLPEADWTWQYLLVLLPAATLTLAITTCIICLFCVRCPGTPIIDHEEQKEALVASFYLVVRDCLTCCGDGEEKKKDRSSSCHVRADDDFKISRQRRRSSCGGGEQQQQQQQQHRQRRASSVQRQTDTLRRLARERDVTQRLRAGAYVPSVIDNPAYLLGGDGGGAGAAEGVGTGGETYDYGGPIILMSDTGSVEGGSSPEGSLHRYHLGGGGGGSNRGLARDPLGSLPRPRPPAYYEPGGFEDDDNTYLV